jgi:Flp pilus assembly protein TadG
MRFNALGRLARDRRGNVAMIFGLAAIPLLFAIGMGVDYANNARRWSQMNAAADAAALAAVTPQMMTQSNSAAQTAATDMFNAQIAGFTGLTFNPTTNLTVTIANSGLTRTATVSYSAQVANVFGGILGANTMSISGSAQASGSTPPNVDFYLLLDTSPSMAIPGAQAGINTMLSHTTAQGGGGCAFACHEANPSADNLGNPGGEDNYALARALGLTLRIDEVGQAAAAMVGSAISTMSQNTSNWGWTPTYRIAISSFDLSLHSLFALTSNLSSLQSSLSANPSPIQVMEVYDNNNICANSQCSSGTGNSDADTNIDAALSGPNGLNTSTSANYIPNPGTGATQSTPAEVLMIVTDGVEDEKVGSITAGNSLSISGGYRQQAPIAANSNVPSTAACTAIKNRGIKVAVLYTVYYPLDNGSAGSWYDSYIYQFQPGGVSGDKIGPDLQNNCASPGLFYQVNVGEDISAALVTLFQMALQSPRLTL